MSDLLQRVSVVVNGREIAVAAIAAEAQHHPAHGCGYGLGKQPQRL
jgi:hypothetical protein